MNVQSFNRIPNLYRTFIKFEAINLKLVEELCIFFNPYHGTHFDF